MKERLNNLSLNTRKDFYEGNIKVIKKILREEYEEVKEELVSFPIAQVENHRGKATLLKQLLKLLEEQPS